MATEAPPRPSITLADTAGITITYGVDTDRGRIHWRCESEDCPSRMNEPGRPFEPFVGTIEFEDVSYGMMLLGAVAVAHAVHLDSANLAALTHAEVIDGD